MAIEFQCPLVCGGRGTGIRPRESSDTDGVRIGDRGECRLGDPCGYVI
jgi:hypothetical protein